MDKDLLLKCCRQVRDLSGDIAEIGVWRGDSALVLLAHSECQLYLYDTFSGFPPGWDIKGVDYHKAGGEFGDTSLEFVQGKLRRWESRIIWRPGIFPETAQQDGGPFKLVHIDCDLYRSTRDALAWAGERMSPGGIILSDDYGCSTAMGAKKAIDEWLAASSGWQLERIGYRGVLRQQQAEVML